MYSPVPMAIGRVALYVAIHVARLGGNTDVPPSRLIYTDWRGGRMEELSHKYPLRD